MCSFGNLTFSRITVSSFSQKPIFSDAVADVNRCSCSDVTKTVVHFDACHVRTMRIPREWLALLCTVLPFGVTSLHTCTLAGTCEIVPCYRFWFLVVFSRLCSLHGVTSLSVLCLFVRTRCVVDFVAYVVHCNS